MERNLIYFNYTDIKESCARLSQKIQERGWNIDVIVPILKGGLNTGALLGNELDIDNFSCVHTRSSIGNGTNANFKEPVLLGVTNEKEIVGKDVLITDDIFDSGRSIDLTINVLKELGAKNVYVAVNVIVNEKALKREDIVFDYNFITENYWIVFPWEKA